MAFCEIEAYWTEVPSTPNPMCAKHSRLNTHKQYDSKHRAGFKHLGQLLHRT